MLDEASHLKVKTGGAEVNMVQVLASPPRVQMRYN